MKHKQMVDPDLEVIDMVNDGVAGRQRVREGRALLARMSKEQAQARKAAWWRAFRSMVIEAGTFVVGVSRYCSPWAGDWWIPGWACRCSGSV